MFGLTDISKKHQLYCGLLSLFLKNLNLISGLLKNVLFMVTAMGHKKVEKCKHETAKKKILEEIARLVYCFYLSLF